MNRLLTKTRMKTPQNTNPAAKKKHQDQHQGILKHQAILKRQKRAKLQNTKIQKNRQTKNNYTKKEHLSQTQNNKTPRLHNRQDQRTQLLQVNHLPEAQAHAKNLHRPLQNLRHHQAQDPPLCFSNQKAVTAPNGQHHSSILEKENIETH